LLEASFHPVGLKKKERRVITGRTAWILADTNHFAGANTCTLWRVFASRGLGTNTANHVNGTSVPAGC
jgi:extracellular elastinolytic metalloproteinase